MGLRVHVRGHMPVLIPPGVLAPWDRPQVGDHLVADSGSYWIRRADVKKSAKTEIIQDQWGNPRRLSVYEPPKLDNASKVTWIDTAFFILFPIFLIGSVWLFRTYQTGGFQ